MSDAPSPRDEQLRADLASLRLDRGAATAPRRGKRRGGAGKWLALVIVAAALAGGAFWFANRALPVTVATATRIAAADVGPVPLLSGSGYIVTGERYVSIGVRVAGRIDRYFVEEGQSVHRDDPLVQLDDRDYRALVAQTEAGLAVARANLRLADSELKRGVELYRDKVVSQQELDILRNKQAVAAAEVRRLEAELDQAKVNLEYTLLRSPTNGVVLAKLKEVGEIAVPGGFAGSGDLIRLANLSDMRAELDVNEADLNRVRMGQAARVTPDAYPDSAYDARVVKLYPQVDRQKGTLKVEVQIVAPDDKLLPDMSARVTFLSDPQPRSDAKPTVLVPRPALRRDDQGNTFVWVINGEHAARTVVETAGDAGDQTRVTSGLNGGESVVVEGEPTHAGQRLRIESRR